MIAELIGAGWLLVGECVNQLSGSVFYVFTASLHGRCLQENYLTDEQTEVQRFLSWDHGVKVPRCQSLNAIPMPSSAVAFCICLHSGMRWMSPIGAAVLSHKPHSKNKWF